MAVMAAMAAAMVVLFIVMFDYIPTTNTPFVQGPETEAATELAKQIKVLPSVHDTGCSGMSTAMSNTLYVLQGMNHVIGTKFGPFRLDPSQCDVVVQYVPILGSYDALIAASNKVDPGNSTSVKVFYEDLFFLSSDFVIMNDKLAYNVAFKSTGEMNNALGLSRLRSVCGDDCYSLVLSGIHWVIRDFMNQFACQFESWLASLRIPYLGPVC
jgi:hypothetical protein